MNKIDFLKFGMEINHLFTLNQSFELFDFKEHASFLSKELRVVLHLLTLIWLLC